MVGPGRVFATGNVQLVAGKSDNLHFVLPLSQGECIVASLSRHQAPEQLGLVVAFTHRGHRVVYCPCNHILSHPCKQGYQEMLVERR